MRPVNKRKKFVKTLSSKFFLFCLILAFAGLAKITVEKYIEVDKAKATLNQEQKKIKEGEKKNTELKETLKYFQTKEYFENIAKKKLNLVKPGEKVIYVMPEKEEEEKKIKEEETKKGEKSFWEKVREFFSKDNKKK